MRSFFFGACVVLAAHFANAASTQGDRAQEPIAEGAMREGTLIVYGSTSERFARYLVDEFKALHPAISVKYVSLPVGELDVRLRRDAESPDGPDVVWSSAMDLQMNAALDGLAQSYRSPEAASLPAWAKWRDQLYATTYEPVVLVYNRQFVQADEVPTTHAALREILSTHADKYRGKVSTYDLDNVEVGALPFRVDAARDARFWELLRVMRAESVDEQSSSATILDRISAGQSLIAYNIAGAEAIRRARRDPLVGVQFTLDYNLVLSRVMFIAKHAPHPDAARLWVDFILSKRGQQQMQLADLYPIREDVSGVDAGIVLLRRTAKVAKPIALDATLVNLCAPESMQSFKERWHNTRGEAAAGSGTGGGRTSGRRLQYTASP
ncbi:MAG TPA: ABC transporter substrate-binding protein [Casimicrobiaceae bacterium]